MVTDYSSEEGKKKNYKTICEIVNEEFSNDDGSSSERSEALLNMYADYKEQMMEAPAASKLNFHNAAPGGYMDHVIRVVETAKLMHRFYVHEGGYADYEMEELVFAALHHDLGKLGLPGQPKYVPQESEWHQTNKLEMYKPNEATQYMRVSDMSMFILQRYGVEVTQKEMLGIKMADGLYDDANKPYFIQYGHGPMPMHTSLPKIVHWSDHMATTIENDVFRKKWLQMISE